MNLKRSKSKKRFKEIIIIEGLWGTGKTTLCRYLQKYHNFRFLQEPNHIKSGFRKKDQKTITNWYFKEHLKNLKQGLRIVNKGSNVVIERSPISSIAFAKTCFKEASFYKNKFVALQKLLLNSKIRPLLIFLKPRNIKSLSYYLNNSQNKNVQIYSDKKFLERCNKNLSLFLHQLDKENLINLIIKTDKAVIRNFQNIISKLL